MTIDETIEYLKGKVYYFGLSLMHFENFNIINDEYFEVDIIVDGEVNEIRLSVSASDNEFAIRGRSYSALAWMIGRFNIDVNNKFITFSSHSIIKTYHELIKIDVSKYTKNKNEDIYIISLRYFKDNLEKGITFRDYINFINSVYPGSFKNYRLYARLFDQITDIDHIKQPDLKTFATIESIFRLLEYEELQLATQQATAANEQAKEAKIESSKAFKVAMASLIATVVFALFQLAYQGWHDINEDADNDTKHSEIIDLMKQSKKKDTIIVNVAIPPIKNKKHGK